MAISKKLKIRPYARLLTMLGEQLIKNERIALIELIKNSYDADADWVKISFTGFDEDFSITSDSKIIIEDNGHGMDSRVIENHWLNSATPEKLRRKKIKETTSKGRIIQGEKGIGRFALLKLGRKIRIITRAKKGKNEYRIDFDFSNYDDEFITEKGHEKDLFIDDLTVSMQTREPKVIIRKPVKLGKRIIPGKPHGTRLVISNLKGSWSDNKIKNVYKDIARLESIFAVKKSSSSKKSEFKVVIYKDDEFQNYEERYIEKLNILLNDRAVIKVENGIYDERKEEFRFTKDSVPSLLKLRDPRITGLNVFKERFGQGGKELDKRKTECGSFKFVFYIFDFSSQAPANYLLDKEDKDILRDHRIYLYRDNIRVYPYGDPDDDWLRIDQYRGTISAGHFLSNDQVVGYVSITQKENNRLKDKTNREGLIEEGNVTEDFIVLLQTFLRYIRQKPYAIYREKLKTKSAQNIFHTEQIQKEINSLKDAVKNDKKVFKLVSQVEKKYKTERKYLVQRAETTEELAGVGLSVETASHDIMGIMGKAMSSIDYLISDVMHDDLDKEELQKELQSLRGMLSFIEAQLKNIQLLFKSSKQRRRNIKVKEILEKIERIYRRLLKKENIALHISKTKSPLVAKTTDAVLLQLFLNLFDNAIYWHQQTTYKNKSIEINLDGNNGQLIFSDNGPGVDKEDAPYIFEPFYSGKGDEGRGLGLYIARQLLERNDYTIELAELKSEKILPGANFVVNFIAEENR